MPLRLGEGGGVMARPLLMRYRLSVALNVALALALVAAVAWGTYVR